MYSNELGLLVLDALSSPLVVLDNSGVIVYVNRAWKQFADTNALAMENYGIGCNYLAYCDDTEINLTFYETSVAQGIRNVLSGNQEEYLCQYSCHSTIEERWFQMRATRFAVQGCLYAVVVHENIALCTVAEKWLSAILKVAPLSMAIVSLKGQILEVNQSLVNILGYESQELLSLTCKQITHPDDFDNDFELLQNLLDGKQISYCTEKRLIKKNGDVIFVSLTSSVLRCSSGRPILLIKQIQDITEKIKTETALRNSEHRLNMILDHMPALIGYWNKELINEFGNKVYLDWFGLEPAQIKGKHLREVIGEPLFELNKPFIENVLCGKPQRFECIIRDVSGIDIHTLAYYVPDFYGKTINGFFGSSRFRGVTTTCSI